MLDLNSERPEQPDSSGVAPEQPVVHRPRHTLFIGPQGLRAGWACLLFLAAMVLLGLLAGFILKLLHVPAAPRGVALSALQMGGGETVAVALVLLATFGMARLERRPRLSFGLGDRYAVPRFIGGLVSGFAAISALVGLLWSRHLLVLHSAGLSTGSIARSALAWGLVFLLVGFFEEMLLRGYLLFTLARGIGFFWAALLLSVAFGAIHGKNPGETPVGLFSAGAVGLVFCLSIWYTRSLWWAIGAHAAWDWGESFFWGTSDSGLMVKGHLFNEHATGPALLSGGATGPEGSVFVFPILLLLALGIFLWWRRERPAGFS